MGGRHEFLMHMEKLRAFAIFLVVAGHLALSVGFPGSNRFSAILFNLLSGGTVVFVFVSGYLFHYLFSEFFSYKSYLWKKCKLILVPYLVVGSPAVIFLLVHKDPSYGGFFLPDGPGFWSEYIVPVTKYLVTGRFLQAYWFVPFIALIFILSPVVLFFGSFPVKVQVFLLVALIVVALLVHRPVWSMNPIHSLIYYIPVYLLGFFVSGRHSLISRFIQKREAILLLLLALFFSVVQERLGDNGSYFKEMFVWGGVDLQLAQKILVCLALFSLFYHSDRSTNPVVRKLSEASFSIYFLHPYMLIFLAQYVKIFEDSVSVLWLIFPVLLFMIIVVSIGLAMLVRLFFPEKSKYIVGY